MTTFNTFKDESFLAGNYVLRKRVYRFEAHLLFDKSSYNITGLDILPRFMIKPKKLLNVLNFSVDPNSVSSGFVRNQLFEGTFVKNTGLSDERLLLDFDLLSTRQPFGFTGKRSYKIFVNKAFDAAYQSQLQALWNMTGGETTSFEHEYVERSVEAKSITTNYFEEINEFVPYAWEGNKEKGVIIS